MKEAMDVIPGVEPTEDIHGSILGKDDKPPEVVKSENPEANIEAPISDQSESLSPPKDEIDEGDKNVRSEDQVSLIENVRLKDCYVSLGKRVVCDLSTEKTSLSDSTSSVLSSEADLKKHFNIKECSIKLDDHMRSITPKKIHDNGTSTVPAEKPQ